MRTLFVALVFICLGSSGFCQGVGSFNRFMREFQHHTPTNIIHNDMRNPAGQWDVPDAGIIAGASAGPQASQGVFPQGQGISFDAPILSFDSPQNFDYSVPINTQADTLSDGSQPFGSAFPGDSSEQLRRPRINWNFAKPQQEMLKSSGGNKAAGTTNGEGTAGAGANIIADDVPNPGIIAEGERSSNLWLTVE